MAPGPQRCSGSRQADAAQVLQGRDSRSFQQQPGKVAVRGARHLCHGQRAGRYVIQGKKRAGP
ncbi:MAG: hypothetical protein B7X79_09770 [Acidovorax sp. 17-64-282]|nr:MAG: hypothetical protein B7Z11_05890 [Acidovorax sp. 32-64-7]OYY85207.1 MAG: hypothetical protein B7Y46_10155 [Acidovorax sp. 28-64-14]OYZ44151.1 MAG: hypothetical protein B7Y20_12435 [Acidovorax sp. 16-64-162]OZA56708.1 MAG: hypothetical protein B7X79_09770 [Acidovorax sp. 17-64-282]OZA71144.1 MAG: hypothetical protein B7X70_04015 [Acidovorax sp. 39-64-12]